MGEKDGPDDAKVGAMERAPEDPMIPPSSRRGEDDWVEVRESWVGDGPGEPMQIPRYAADLPPAPAETTSEDAATSGAKTQEIRPRSVPPPLPPPSSAPIVARSAAHAERERVLAARMAERFAAADYDGAARVAAGLLRLEPSREDAVACRALCHTELGKLYRARLGDLSRVPRIAAGITDLRAADLDVSAGLLLSRIDGVATLAAIVECGIVPELDALKILSEMFLTSVIVVGQESGPKLGS
jgi:hypothetical protein